MERLQQVLAFPLYATVIWLAWVLSAQLDNDAVGAPARDAAADRVRALGVADDARGGARRWGVAALAGSPPRRSSAGRSRSAVIARRRGGAETRLPPQKGPWQDFTPERVRELTACGP